jgi:hypothetical protein
LIPFAVAAVTAALQLAVAAAPGTPRTSTASASPATSGRPPRAPARAPARAPLEDSAPEPAPVRDDPREAVDLSAYPPEQRERYLLAREKCARCHGFDRAVNSRLTVAEWTRHLRKMAVRPNTAISDEQAQAILEFLKFYASQK